MCLGGEQIKKKKVKKKTKKKKKKQWRQILKYDTIYKRNSYESQEESEISV